MEGSYQKIMAEFFSAELKISLNKGTSEILGIPPNPLELVSEREREAYLRIKVYRAARDAEGLSGKARAAARGVYSDELTEIGYSADEVDAAISEFVALQPSFER